MNYVTFSPNIFNLKYREEMCGRNCFGSLDLPQAKKGQNKKKPVYYYNRSILAKFHYLFSDFATSFSFRMHKTLNFEKRFQKFIHFLKLDLIHAFFLHYSDIWSKWAFLTGFQFNLSDQYSVQTVHFSLFFRHFCRIASIRNRPSWFTIW